MGRRIIDISVPLQSDIASDPPGTEPKLSYFDHRQCAAQVCSFFPGLSPAELPDGEGWAVERVDISTHNGTHLDAPWHFASTMDNGKRAITIDEVPLEWCFQPGVKLDFRHFGDGYVATAADVEAELERIGHQLRPLDIVVVNTSAGRRYGQPDYVPSGSGMGREATLYLTSRGVKITGTDAWSWDAPFVQERQADLGRPQGGPRNRLLSHREIAQPRAAAAARFPDCLLPGQNQSRLRRLDPRRCHHRGVSTPGDEGPGAGPDHNQGTEKPEAPAGGEVVPRAAQAAPAWRVEPQSVG
jgi:kynurenine formamidase